MYYFDNAATTFKKPKRVISEVNKCLCTYCGNPGRSAHKNAVKSSEKIFEARENVVQLFNYSYPENVIFTHNATHGLNIAIKSLVNQKMGVIISDLEHNSVIRPLYKCLKTYGGEISVYNTDNDLEEEIKRNIKEDTRVIISTLCSNVTGKVINPYLLSDIAKKYNLSLILDASQYAGHLLLDLTKCEFDAIVAPGHKALFGIQGSGFLILKNKLSFETLIEGGSGFDTLSASMPEELPERFEAGTPATPSIVGLSEGIKYILSVGQEQITERLKIYTEKCTDILLNFKEVKLYSAENGIVSFKFGNQPSSVTSALLERHDIASRSGLHCSPIIHRKLGTLDTGLVRLSFSYLNSKRELDMLYKALKDIQN